ncbi:unnamed protein product [Symbiodinium sp. CCMP2456]|nr:unnamed protein product [Symbiodinium sp. CCMP2456]
MAEVDSQLIPAKRRRITKERTELEVLLAEEVSPPDFGGRLASMLWDVQVQHSFAVEYIHLFFGVGRVPLERRTRRVVTPEMYSLLRCSRSMRRSLIAAVEARRLTLEPDASDDETSLVDELCNALRYKYPASWASVAGRQPPPADKPAPIAL